MVPIDPTPFRTFHTFDNTATYIEIVANYILTVYEIVYRK